MKYYQERTSSIMKMKGFDGHVTMRHDGAAKQKTETLRQATRLSIDFMVL